jgi:hypothetical protein
MNQLFKEAIADAKQIREAALVNAKKALEEAFAPKIQSMISSKLNEMDNYEEELEEMYHSKEEEMEEGFETSQGNWDQEDDSLTLEEDFNIDEILAEMDMEEGEEEELEEGKKKEDKKEKKEDGEDEEMESEDEEMESEDEEVGDMTVSELKDLIKSIVTQEIEHEEMETPEEEANEPEHMGMEMGTEMSDDQEIDLSEILAELDNMYEEELEEGKMTKKVSSKKVSKPADKKPMKDGKEMNEAIKTINVLRKELNEVNLLNAKLLYVNKIFKSKNLTESQKIKVITAFDKATTTKEAKMVFESLSSTLETKSIKQPIKESLGFASKAAGVAPRKNTIIETNDVVSRMQKLANIK